MAKLNSKKRKSHALTKKKKFGRIGSWVQQNIGYLTSCVHPNSILIYFINKYTTFRSAQTVKLFLYKSLATDAFLAAIMHELIDDSWKS